MFEDFLLKDCKILLDAHGGMVNGWADNLVLVARVLEVDDKLMKVSVIADIKGFNKRGVVPMFNAGDEVYLSINHITAISINYDKV